MIKMKYFSISSLQKSYVPIFMFQYLMDKSCKSCPIFPVLKSLTFQESCSRYSKIPIIPSSNSSLQKCDVPIFQSSIIFSIQYYSFQNDYLAMDVFELFSSHQHSMKYTNNFFQNLTKPLKLYPNLYI